MSDQTCPALTVIGLRRLPSQPLWQPLYGRGELTGTRFDIPFPRGAEVEILPPNHHQVYALDMADSEPTVHLRPRTGVETCSVAG